jgi:hypothetical protein
MEKKVIKSATIAGFVVAMITAFAAVTVVADSYTSIEVDVPFAFNAGQSMLPAGKYKIRSGGSITNSVTRITSADEKKTVYLSTLSARSGVSKEKTVVTFHRYGNQYFLYQVWAEGDNTGTEVPKSSREKRVASGIDADMAQSSGGVAPEVVVIVAK